MEKGIEIRDMFGGPFEEMRAHRKTLWALDVKIHPELFSQEEIDAANAVLSKARELNAQIENLISNEVRN